MKVVPTADVSNIRRPNGPAYSTDELSNTPLDCRSASLRMRCYIGHKNTMHIVVSCVMLLVMFIAVAILAD